MTSFPVHTPESAPEGSREVLRNVKASLGTLPNLAAAMAESPTLVRAFFTVREIYLAGTFTEAEVHLLSMANAYENECTWCMAFHTFMAEKSGANAESMSAIRGSRLPADMRDRALTELSREFIRNRGKVSSDAVDSFITAGFTRAQVLEVILGVAFSTMANYTQHVVHAPLNDMLLPYAWSKPAETAH